MSSSFASLVARDLTKSFGPHVVLDHVSCTVGPLDRVGVVAPNGTGKSTLLKILAGLDAPDSGTVTRTPPTATVGYLPQEPERRAGETVRAYLARRTGVAEADETLHAASAALADRKPGADDIYAQALERYLTLGAADFDARVGAVCADRKNRKPCERAHARMPRYRARCVRAGHQHRAIRSCEINLDRLRAQQRRDQHRMSARA